MKCQSMINRTASRLYNLCGYNTTKQNSELAVKLGQEIFDFCKEQPLSDDLLFYCMKKYCPGMEISVYSEIASKMRWNHCSDKKLNIIIGEDKLRNYLESLRYPKNIIEAEVKCKGIFFPYAPGLKGGTIYLKDEGNLKDLNRLKVFCHEFNHFLDYNYSTYYTKRKMNYLFKKSSFGKLFKKMYKSNASDEEPKYIIVHRNLLEMFGLKDMNKQQRIFIPDTSNTPEGILNFYGGNNYNGLNNSKRIDAYIRAVLRHSINPKNKDIIKELKFSKRRLSFEHRAHKTSEIVERYGAKNYNEISVQGLSVDIIERLLKIIDKEIWVARKERFLNLFGIHSKKSNTTGLPISAYIKE